MGDKSELGNRDSTFRLRLEVSGGKLAIMHLVETGRSDYWRA